MSRYVVKEKYVKNIVEGKLVTDKVPVIMEEYICSNGEPFYIPSFLNKVIYKKYRLKPMSSGKNVAITICEFMNYIDYKVTEGIEPIFINLKEEKIHGLNFQHLTHFLDYCGYPKPIGKGNEYKTVKQKEERLKFLYIQLIGLGIIKNPNVKFKYNMVANPYTKKKVKIEISPLSKVAYQVTYPTKQSNGKVKIVDLPEVLWERMIFLSREYTKEITFGLILQMFGGLRRGQVVNLRYDDIHTTDNMNLMNVTIQRRPELFEDRYVNIDTCGVKKTRGLQPIFNINSLLYTYYSEHMEERARKLYECNTNTDALMVDDNGNAMTGTTYKNKFNKLKQIFLEDVKKHSYKKYIELRDATWSTHIGRGIFSNILVSRGYVKTARDLANLRQDDNEESAKVYMNSLLAFKEIDSALNIINREENIDQRNLRVAITQYIDYLNKEL